MWQPLVSVSGMLMLRRVEPIQARMRSLRASVHVHRVTGKPRNASRPSALMLSATGVADAFIDSRQVLLLLLFGSVIPQLVLARQNDNER